ncbi:MAG TPA: hypothetical protein VK821_06995, partial [Dehalococcoidia bacterium]|nr:hypothetical protein [Dehalococcoidia bacterium]
MSPGGSKSGDWTRRGAAFVRASILANRWFVWRLGTSLALAYVAAGRIAAYVSFVPLPPLHNAAGCLLASEAGATV